MPDPVRPDPDVLLRQIQQSDEARQRGRLTIFFGASAGVGKTYAMLNAAHQEVAKGKQVLAGVIETHGRQDTAQLLEGLACLPPKRVEYRGQYFNEFDLDAALLQKPDVLLVDELAHSNVPGSRHLKRWQDIEELLEAGITVYTTLNVQHLESLRDIVVQVTGITVRETVPDRVFNQADDVILVDLPADELLTRLQAGKVYLSEQAKRAANHFFRKGNLIALRELALRRTAERVDAQMRDYRSDARINTVWNTTERLLVGIGVQGHSERLVRHAARLATSLNAQWFVIHVETPDYQKLTSAKQIAIQQQLRLAASLGANIALITAPSVVQGLTQYATEHNIARVVLGSRQRPYPLLRLSLVHQLARALPELDLILVNQTLPQSDTHTSGKIRPSLAQTESPRHWTSWIRTRAFRGYSYAVLGCLLITLGSAGLTQWFDLANVIMLYLLLVVAISARTGRGPGVLAAVLGILSFDFFFVPPRFSFSVSDTQYFLTFTIMLMVALLINRMAATLRFQADIAARHARESQSLAQLSQQLTGALAEQQIIQIARQWLTTSLVSELAILTLDAQDQLILAYPEAPLLPDGFDQTIAQWVFDHQQEAGQGTYTLAANRLHYVPLKAPMRVRGVIALTPQPAHQLQNPEYQRLLHTALAQIALALERVHFVDIAQHALVKIEGERLRSSLLSALSHDLRTPVTALAGLSSTLAHSHLSATQQVELATDVERLANLIHGLVTNLLDLARLQSGGLHLNWQWISLEELIGGVCYQLDQRLKQHKIQVHIPPTLALIQADEIILARILTNLLDNAARYTPPESTVTITAFEPKPKWIEVTVCDDGPGIPEDMQSRIFERFTRGQHESTETGLGLGLALCREMISSMGGSLHVSHHQPHGACFHLRWPQQALSPDTLQQVIEA